MAYGWYREHLRRGDTLSITLGRSDLGDLWDQRIRATLRFRPLRFDAFNSRVEQLALRRNPRSHGSWYRLYTRDEKEFGGTQLVDRTVLVTGLGICGVRANVEGFVRTEYTSVGFTGTILRLRFPGCGSVGTRRIATAVGLYSMPTPEGLGRRR